MIFLCVFHVFFRLEPELSQEMSDILHEKRVMANFSDKSLSFQTDKILKILTKDRFYRKNLAENTLQSFIHKNFNENMPDRLKTFEKFAFSNVERDEHKYIKPLLTEIKTFKEPHGTMLVTDLWSKNLQKECLEKSNMWREKKMLEKYLFYKNKTQKKEKKKEISMDFQANFVKSLKKSEKKLVGLDKKAGNPLNIKKKQGDLEGGTENCGEAKDICKSLGKSCEKK